MHAVNRLSEQDSRYLLNSPLLFGSLDTIDPETRIDILDLAPATPELLEYFSPRHCKLYLPGCRESLLNLRMQEEQDEQKLPVIFNRLIPLSGANDKALDIILLWDLPNYLDKQVLTGLIQHLLPRLDRNSVLHTYIHTRQSMPETPAVYRLTCENKLIVDISSAAHTDSPMYYQELLHKVIRPFRVDRGMLLANGLQEYILRVMP